MKFLPTHKKNDDDLVNHISKKYNIHKTVASIIASRVKVDEIDGFINNDTVYDPFLLNDMQEAVDCINRHIKEGNKITVYGDYDVDGITSVSVLYMYLKSVGGNVDVFIPDRHKDGYGLNYLSLDSIGKNGTKLLITVDCGISNVDEIEYAKKSGMEVIVSDHHQCPQKLPKCTAVINPLLKDYPCKFLCGCGVALKLVQGLGGQDAYNDYVDLASLATVTDVVSLKGENRTIVKKGLEKVNGENCRSSIKALKDVAGCKKDITAGVYGFYLGPRINAAGRIGNPMDAFNLLVCDDYDKAFEYAQKLNEYNNIRHKEEEEILSAVDDVIEKQINTNNRIIILCNDGWNKGVIGIVAGKVAEKYNRPTIVFSKDQDACTGSARSIKGINIFNAIVKFGDLTEKMGGHEMAAGLTVKTCNFEEFCSKIINHFNNKTIYDDELFIPRQEYDEEINMADITDKLVEDLQILAPFGMGNSTPTFKLSAVEFDSIKQIGTNKNHIKCHGIKDKKSVDIVGFGFGDAAHKIHYGIKYDVVGTVELNRWNNFANIQMQMKNFKPNICISGDNIIFKNGQSFFNSLHKASLLENKQVDAKRIRRMWNWETYLKRRIKKDVLSTCIYSAVPTCAYALKDFIVNEGLEDNLDFYFGKPSANSCVVFAPDWDCDVIPYERLVIFDYAPTDFINRVLEKNPNIQIVICNNTATSNNIEKFIMGLELERETAVKAYGVAKRVGNGEANVRTYIEEFCKSTNETPFNAAFAISVFNELGFVSLEGLSFSLLPLGEEKKDINASEIKKNICALKEKIYSEINLIIPEKK